MSDQAAERKRYGTVVGNSVVFSHDELIDMTPEDFEVAIGDDELAGDASEDQDAPSGPGP